MSTTNLESRCLKFDHQSKADKHFWAGYCNLAEDNLNALGKAFIERFPEAKGKNLANSVSNYFNDKLSYDSWKQGIHFLAKYLPVVFQLDYIERFTDEQKERSDAEYRKCFRDSLHLLLSPINNLRNFYSHHYHKSMAVDENLFELLDKLFVATCQDVLQHRKKSDKTEQSLSKKLKEEFPELIELGKQEPIELRKKNKGISTADDQVRNTVFDHAFRHLFHTITFTAKDAYKAKQVDIEQTENKIPFSKSGLVFYLSMFLNRKHAKDLRSHVQYFKATDKRSTDKPLSLNNNSLKFMATHWVFSHLAYREVKAQLSSQFSNESFMLQMVDELNKVPKEVYDGLKDEIKKQFLEDVNEYTKEGNQSLNELDALVSHEVIRKRYENKFAYQAIRFLDEYANFPSLRFQVHLGNYVHDKRTKAIEGTDQETSREVKEKVYVFGKLSEIAELKNDFFERRAKEGTFWQRYPNPSYNFIGGNIPIYIDPQHSPLVPVMLAKDGFEKNEKQVVRVENKLSKQSMTLEIEPNLVAGQLGTFYLGKPVAMLSLNELPALLYHFLHTLKNQVKCEKDERGKKIERTIQNKIAAHFSTLKNYNPEVEKLHRNKVPKNFNRSANFSQPNFPKLKAAIKNELSITSDKKQLISQNQNERKDRKRKYIFNNHELGQEATWLANDLKRFMPQYVKEQWRAQHHSHLQLTLAFYEKRPKEAYKLLSHFWDWKQSPYWSSLIDSAFKASQFHQFYLQHLHMRETVLNKFLNQLEDFDEMPTESKKVPEDVWQVFRKRLYTTQTLAEQKNRLFSKPIVLPRGLFDDKPTYIKGKNIDDHKADFADWYVYALSNEHNFQSFYNLESDPSYFQKLMEEDAEIQKNTKQLNLDDQLKYVVKKHEQVIKKLKIQDLFCRDMVAHAFQHLFNQDFSSSLSDFYQSPAEKLQIKKQIEAQHQRSQGDKSPNQRNTTFIWNMEVDYKHNKGQLTERVRLGDMGKLKYFLQGEKVQALFSYKPEWTLNELEEELYKLPTSYEVIRREVLLKNYHEFEKKVLSYWKNPGSSVHPKELEMGGNPNFKCYVLNGVLKKTDLATAAEIKPWLNSYFDTLQISEVEASSNWMQSAYILILIRKAKF